MKSTVYPAKLKPGDTIRIIAPARSLSIISEELRAYADAYFGSHLKLNLEFSKHTLEIDDFKSSSIQSRIADIHDAFLDANVKGILTVIGGYNSNQLLDYLDWDIIAANPKILCGYSDITALQNAMYAKTGLVTYSGPHYITFGQKIFDEYTTTYFKKCLYSTEPYSIEPSTAWTDDEWYLDQNKRHPISNTTHGVINTGTGAGVIIGGNLCTLNLLQGSPYFPKESQVVLFLEDDEETSAEVFDRDLQSLLHALSDTTIKAVVIGRFQKGSEITQKTLQDIIVTKSKLQNIPVVYGIDFGHTDPKITFPIGGHATVIAKRDSVSITIDKH